MGLPGNSDGKESGCNEGKKKKKRGDRDCKVWLGNHHDSFQISQGIQIKEGKIQEALLINPR